MKILSRILLATFIAAPYALDAVTWKVIDPIGLRAKSKYPFLPVYLQKDLYYGDEKRKKIARQKIKQIEMNEDRKLYLVSGTESEVIYEKSISNPRDNRYGSLSAVKHVAEAWSEYWHIVLDVAREEKDLVVLDLEKGTLAAFRYETNEKIKKYMSWNFQKGTPIQSISSKLVDVVNNCKQSQPEIVIRVMSYHYETMEFKTEAECRNYADVNIYTHLGSYGMYMTHDVTDLISITKRKGERTVIKLL
jgi:hypothetical protein